MCINIKFCLINQIHLCHALNHSWVKSRNCDWFVTWFCYQLIANQVTRQQQFHDPTQLILLFAVQSVYQSIVPWCHLALHLSLSFRTNRYIILQTHIYLKKKYNAIKWSVFLNSSPPRQNGHHFTGNIFKCIFMKEKYSFFITISLKFVPTDSLDNKPALV